MEAFGEIGILPHDFYRMRVDDYLLLRRGWVNKRYYEQNLLREGFARLANMWTDKGLNKFRWWPQGNDAEIKKESKFYVSPEGYKRLEKLKDESKPTDRG